MAMSGLQLHGHTVVAGLGGRAITRKSLRALFAKAVRGELGHLTFLDLAWNVVNKQLERERTTCRSGLAAESMLCDIGVVVTGIV